jgi:predicted nucleotidyltransferase
VLLAKERAALGDFSDFVRARFGARLSDLRLFGSRARAAGNEESDLDVLVVVDGLTSLEAREIAGAAGDVLTRHEVLLSPFALGRDRYEHLRARERRIIAEIERDGVPL